MRPPKLAKAYQQETISVFYGIDQTTLTVQRVWLTRAKMLWTFVGGQLNSHYIDGKPAVAEIIIVWGLAEVFEVLPANEPDVIDRVKKLEATAAAMWVERLVGAEGRRP